MADFNIDPVKAQTIRWNLGGSCGDSGCSDPECCCSICGQPIGVSEDDPRWDDHDEDCIECDVCRDRIPMILFRGEGKSMMQAQFHFRCFEGILQS